MVVVYVYVYVPGDRACGAANARNTNAGINCTTNLRSALVDVLPLPLLIVVAVASAVVDGVTSNAKVDGRVRYNV